MSRLRAALLFAAWPLQAACQKEAEEQHSVSTRFDPVSSSFYIHLSRKVAAPGCRPSFLEQQAKWVCTALACGAIREVAARGLFDKVLHGGAGNQPRTHQAEDKASGPRHVAEPCALEEEPGRSTSRRGLGAFIAGLAAAVALAGAKARGTRLHKRHQSTTACSVNTPRSRLSDVSDKSTSAGSTPGGSRKSTTEQQDDQDDSGSEGEFEEELHGEREDVGKMALAGGAAERERVRRSLLGRTEATTFCRQRTDPSGDRGSQDARHKEWRIPGPRPINDGLTQEVPYSTNGFVRQRTEEYERRIDENYATPRRISFHRIATEGTANAEDNDSYMNEYENMNVKTAFFRIGTENV